MFTFYLTYQPKLWKGFEKQGFINELTGVRFPQSITQEKELMFNNLAAKNGNFYNLIKDNKYPLYIDRLQGGCYYEGYDYDFTLINNYREMLADKFAGFQMHEWMTNFRGDLKKLKDCTEWTEKGITENILSKYPFKHLFVESHSAKEFAEMGRVDDLDKFLSESKKLFSKRQFYTDNLLIPCDSYYMAFPLEIKLGAKRLMPEVGAQIANTRVQLAFARGVAKANKIPFGTYYEPWGGSPFSACLYNKKGENEWNIKSEDFPYKTNQEEGGSSRSLQWRIYLYSYLAGAQFISDEWGGGNAFYDWDNEYAVSPYGKLQLKLINFIKKYPDVGKIFTPICIVISKDIPVLEIEHFNLSDSIYLDFENKDTSLSKKINAARLGVRELVASSTNLYGNDEKYILINSDIPDAFDICSEDKIIDDYDYYVDLTESTALSSKKTVSINQAKELVKELMPCTVTGNAHWFVNNTASAQYLSIFNNDGINKTENGEHLLSEATSIVKVNIKYGKTLKPLEGNSLFSLNADEAIIEIPAGGWFFGTII